MNNSEGVLSTVCYHLFGDREAAWSYGERRKDAAYRGELPGGRNHMKRGVRIGQTAIGIVGVLGTLACMGAMVLAVAGVAGVGTSAVGASAAMAGMSMGTQGQATSGPHPGILAFLLQAGPVILLVSIGAFALSLATRRWVAAIPALLVGGVIYWGMYGQPRLPVMYVTMALGLLGWAVVFLWVRGLPREMRFLFLRYVDDE